MKIKLLLLLLICLFSFSAFAQTPAPAKDTPQKTISEMSDDVLELGDAEELSSPGSFPERKLVGKVVGVHDGDTATVLDGDKRQYKFRFNGIDAPELKMDFGNKSKENLSNWIFGKEVTVVYSKIDKYGRYVGNIFVGGTDVNLEQIKAGMAWHYKKYAGEQSEKDRTAYAAAEAKAKEAKLGFWSLPNPTPPWEYRAALKTKQATEKADRKYETGARGGCFYINSSGNKTYVDKKYCANQPPNVTGLKVTVSPKTETKPAETKTGENKEPNKSDGRIYIKGSRGGCYYMDGDRKVYVKDKTLCGS